MYSELDAVGKSVTKDSLRFDFFRILNACERSDVHRYVYGRFSEPAIDGEENQRGL